MRGIAWNCGGLGQTSTVCELKSLIRSRSPDFVFLTKLKVDATPLNYTLLWYHAHLLTWQKAGIHPLRIGSS
ncbi:hypothetical protein CsatB_015518 [Cannabis sativa]